MKKTHNVSVKSIEDAMQYKDACNDDELFFNIIVNQAMLTSRYGYKNKEISKASKNAVKRFRQIKGLDRSLISKIKELFKFSFKTALISMLVFYFVGIIVGTTYFAIKNGSHTAFYFLGQYLFQPLLSMSAVAMLTVYTFNVIIDYGDDKVNKGIFGCMLLAIKQLFKGVFRQ